MEKSLISQRSSVYGSQYGVTRKSDICLYTSQYNLNVDTQGLSHVELHRHLLNASICETSHFGFFNIHKFLTLVMLAMNSLTPAFFGIYVSHFE